MFAQVNLFTWIYHIGLRHSFKWNQPPLCGWVHTYGTHTSFRVLTSESGQVILVSCSSDPTIEEGFEVVPEHFFWTESISFFEWSDGHIQQPRLLTRGMWQCDSWGWTNNNKPNWQFQRTASCCAHGPNGGWNKIPPWGATTAVATCRLARPRITTWHHVQPNRREAFHWGFPKK